MPAPAPPAPPNFAAGSRLGAGGTEHAVSLGDGTAIGFPTPCGKGRGCGNPLCTMSCIRRVPNAELLHWAGAEAEAAGGSTALHAVARPQGVEEAVEAALRAVHLLGRDGAALFGDEPARLASWCLRGKEEPAGEGWEAWDEAAREGAEEDLRWLRECGEGEGKEEADEGCPISGWPPREAVAVEGEGRPYEARLLLRWLGSGMGLHPSSGRPIPDAAAVLRHLRGEGLDALSVGSAALVVAFCVALWRHCGDEFSCYTGLLF